MMKCGNKFLLRLRASASDGMPASSASSKSNLGAGAPTLHPQHTTTRKKNCERGKMVISCWSFFLSHLFFLPLASFLPSPSSGVGMKFRNWIINYPRFRREATVPDPPHQRNCVERAEQKERNYDTLRELTRLCLLHGRWISLSESVDGVCMGV